MADKLHVGQVDLHTNPNGSMKDYNHMLDLFGGANPSVISQPGDEAVCEGVRGFSCMTNTLPKGIHLEVMNTQNRDTSFSLLAVQIWINCQPKRLVSDVNCAGEDPTPPNRPKEGEPYSLQWWRMGEHRPHPGPRGRVPAVSANHLDAPLIQWCYYRNIHLPSRYIETINRTEERRHNLC